MPPIRVYALVEFTDYVTEYMDGFGIDKSWEISVHFHRRRLTEDQDLYVREGDFVLYGDYFYEITAISWARQLFGQIDHKFEIVATCSYSREGLFDAT